MKRFRKILVGVDLSWGDCFVGDELSEPNAEAVRQAMWLAKLNSASLDLLFALDLSVKAQQLIAESTADEWTLLDEAKSHLTDLVAKAREEGILADSHVLIGKSWLELIRQVLRNGHDLVVAGTRHLGQLKGLLVGSTGIKLLRKCPCPVWITQPQPEKEIKSILVAHDLRTVGDLAMELGCSMAEIHGAQLHVLHSLDFPELDSTTPARISTDKSAQFRTNAAQHIHAQLAGYEFAKPPEMHIVTDRPDFAVLAHIDRHAVELLIMGTIARTGIAGFIVGNTAERLLPRIPCSVLAVKPPGFISPVTI